MPVAWTALRALCLSAALAAPAAAGEAVGPCSPFHASDGDVPTEMPGCSRRARPAPGSLDDELAFRRRRGEADGDASDDDPPPRHRPRRR